MKLDDLRFEPMNYTGKGDINYVLHIKSGLFCYSDDALVEHYNLMVHMDSMVSERVDHDNSIKGFTDGSRMRVYYRTWAYKGSEVKKIVESIKGLIEKQFGITVFEYWPVVSNKSERNATANFIAQKNFGRYSPDGD